MKLSPGIQVDVTSTCTTHLNINAQHMQSAQLDYKYYSGNGIEPSALTRPPKSFDPKPIEQLWEMQRREVGVGVEGHTCDFHPRERDSVVVSVNVANVMT